MGAYDVFDLLCSHGYANFDCHEEGWNKENVDKYIIHRDDEKGLRILLENGYAGWEIWNIQNHD